MSVLKFIVNPVYEKLKGANKFDDVALAVV